MARLTFPDDGQRLVYTTGSGGQVALKTGISVLITTDSSGLIPADIQTTSGLSVAGSTLTIGSDGLIPLFLGPSDGRNDLYAVISGKVYPLNAQPDQLLDMFGTTSHTQDYVLAWDNATSSYTERPPTGTSELGTGSNSTGTVLSLTSTTPADVPSLTTSVSASSGRPVWAQVYAACQQTAVGAGMLTFGIYDVTGGGSTFVCNFIATLPNSVGTYSQFFPIQGQVPLGALSSPRIYKVTAALFRDGSPNANVNILNGSSGAPPSVLTVQAR